jgi:DNA transformation protein
MPADKGFHEYIMNEVLHEIPGVTSRSMFGGWGIYQDGLFFALIADGRLYFKVDEESKADYEKAGSGPFVYEMPGHKKTTMNYYELPDRVIEDREEIKIWVAKAVAVARNKKK